MGSVVLAQPDSRATVVIPSPSKAVEHLKIEIFQSSGSLWDSFHVEPSRNSESQPRAMNSMVNAHVHAQQVLHSLGANNDIGRRGMLHSLLYSLPHIIGISPPENIELVNKTRMVVGSHLRSRKAFFKKPFPDNEKVNRTMCYYIGQYVPSTTGFEKLPPGTTGRSMFRLLAYRTKSRLELANISGSLRSTTCKTVGRRVR